MLDGQGQVTEQYRYDAFGMPTFLSPGDDDSPGGYMNDTSLQNNRFLFTGREWVQSFGFYEYRARAYHPELGRFMSEDPLGIKVKGAKPLAAMMPNIAPGGVPASFASSESNLFTYCGNDPEDLEDPTGLFDMAITPRLDDLGSQASFNSLTESGRRKDGNDTSQAIQKEKGKSVLNKTLSPGKTVEDHREWRNGRIVVFYKQLEPVVIDKGTKLEGVGHNHSNVNGKPNPHSSQFSEDDKALARSGIPVYKVNESNPSQVMRLTPQVDAHGKLNNETPTEVMITH